MNSSKTKDKEKTILKTDKAKVMTNIYVFIHLNTKEVVV